MTRNFDFFFKNVLIGNSGVGKTSLMNWIVDDKFDSNYLATIAVDFKSKNTIFEGHKVKMDIWDTAGQEKFRSLCSTHYKGADSIICVFDMSDPKSFNDLLGDWIDEINIYCNNNNTTIFIVGNKKDCSLMSTEDIKLRISRWNNGSLIDLEKTSKLGNE